MPYIKKDDGRREALRKGKPALNAGELNYQIFYFTKHYDWRKLDYYNNGYQLTIGDFVENFLGETPNYQRYNDMTGCLIRCYKEIKRRLNIDVKNIFTEIMEKYDDEIARYEDIKIKENSDVE
jgi:hypothetical protein